ncbi:MAG TPA: hypothetical protein VFG66_06480 [Gemmatimonadales bacterium]|nr:hypothetical protein [Gemmatimonadales bacterium]
MLQPAAAVADALVAFRPDVIYGLPSALLEAAAALGRRAPRLGVRAVFTSGELLSRAAREALAGRFAVRRRGGRVRGAEAGPVDISPGASLS